MAFFGWPQRKQKTKRQSHKKERKFQFKSKLSFISSSLAFNAILCGPMRLNFCHVAVKSKNWGGGEKNNRGRNAKASAHRLHFHFTDTYGLWLSCTICFVDLQN